MSTDNVIELNDNHVESSVSAAERILAEKNISGGYHFAPGIVIHAPSKRTSEHVAALMAGMNKDEPSQDDVMAVLGGILGDQFQPVMDYLENFPVEGYPELFADLFTNLLKLVPKNRDIEKFMGEVEVTWRAERPDLFD